MELAYVVAEISKSPSPHKVAHAEQLTTFVDVTSSLPFEVAGHYLTKTLRYLSHLILVSVVDIAILPNNDVTAQQNQID